MGQSSWEAKSSLANKEIICNLHNPEAHYRLHKNPLFLPILSRKNPAQVLPTDLFQIHFSNILFAGLPLSLFPSGPPIITLCVFLYSAMRATYAAHLIILDLLTLIITGEEYNTRSFSLRSHLTLILLTWSIGWAPNNARKWQMGFNLAFKGLKFPFA